MRAGAAALAVLVAASAAGPASADAAQTVARVAPAVGPVLSGDRVAWGLETRDGRLRVMRSSPREVAVAIPRATAPDTDRHFMHTPWALAASGHAFAALVHTDTTFRDPPDAAGIAGQPAVVGGDWHAPAVLSGAITERGDEPCVPERAYPVAVAVDGRRVAVAELGAGCDAQRPNYRIVVHAGAATRAIPVGGSVRGLDLAGGHLAWTLEGGGLRIADWRTGRMERTVRASVEDLALSRSGGLAFTRHRHGGGYGWDLDFLASPDAPVRRLARHVEARGVGLAGGRVLFERYRDPGYRRSELLLRGVRGGVTRRLARFRPGHRRVGDLDLARHRATWAVRGAQPRIVLRHL